MEQSPSWVNFADSQEIPRIYGTRKSLTVSTSARHLSLSWASSIQSPRPPPTSWRSILILSSYLRLGIPNGLFPSGFPTNTLYTPLSSPIRLSNIHHLIPTNPVLLASMWNFLLRTPNDDDDDDDDIRRCTTKYMSKPNMVLYPTRYQFSTAKYCSMSRHCKATSNATIPLSLRFCNAA